MKMHMAKNIPGNSEEQQNGKVSLKILKIIVKLL